MARTNDDSLEFADETPDSYVLPVGNPWKVLIVDDEDEVHTITKMVLKDYVFDSRALEFLSAYSSIEAQRILSRSSDIAVLILDVVMESPNSGLDLVKWIRETLGNRTLRIILRTGQPGSAPEKHVILHYEINDYKAKTDLTSIKLFTTITAAIRAYRDLKIVRQSKEAFQKIITASSHLFLARGFQHFVEEVLTQMSNLLRYEDDPSFATFDAIALKETFDSFSILSALGSFIGLTGGSKDSIPDEALKYHISTAVSEKTSLFYDRYYIGYFSLLENQNYVFALRGQNAFNHVDREILQVFSSHVSVALENVLLNQKLESTQRELIYTLGEVLESRSKETGHHVQRVAALSYVVARAAGLSENEAQLLRMASPMHDVGKIGVSDSILNKPGTLTTQEMDEVRRHAYAGYEILRTGGSGLLQLAATIAKTHHERWDGMGYPEGLSGNAIPLVGRITAIADVFDALSHKRVYKKAWPLPEVFSYIESNSGSRFDPQLVELFLANKDKVIEIFQLYPD